MTHSPSDSFRRRHTVGPREPVSASNATLRYATLALIEGNVIAVLNNEKIW